MSTTYLTIVNEVLRRLREDEVSAVTQNTYSKMVGDFVNDAKQLVEDAHEWSALLPNCNTMVLNDNHESHMVTPLSPYSTDFRYTIQIWGTNEEEHER